MKYLNKFLICLSILIGITSCQEDIDFTIQPANPAFKIVTPTTSTAIVFDATNENNPALTVTWEDTKNTNASYTVELATTNNFATTHTITTTEEKTVTWRVGALNTYITETVGLSFNEKQTLYLRVSANGENSQTITLTVTPYGLNPLPKLAVAGNHQGWEPDETKASYVPYIATTLDKGATNYEGYVWLDGGFKFVEPNASGVFQWGNTDWGEDGSFAGLLTSTNEINCQASPAGYYFVKADIGTPATYNVNPVSWGIIGAATPTGWSSDTDLVYNSTNKTLEIDIDLTPGEYKFRANDAWNIELGTLDDDGFLQAGGNLTFNKQAGNYHVVLDLSNPRRYTVTLTKN